MPALADARPAGDRRPAREGGRARQVVVVGLLAALLAFVAAVQVRSQEQVVRTLEGQDPTSLAFLIDDLHRANDGLAAEQATLAVRRDALRSSGGDPSGELQDEERRLRALEGLAPVNGPGVVVTVDARLQALDLQDALNNLRGAGAEAISVDDERVVASSAVRQEGGSVTVDGHPVGSPWVLVAIGDPSRLSAVADLMVRSLRADSRVGSASYRSDPNLAIRSTVPLRPFVYASS
jgi:uncharacterized protein YlxW (UPF0749 family)